MENLDRRAFLKKAQIALGGAALLPMFKASGAANTNSDLTAAGSGTCWLDVCAPFIVEDEVAGIHSEVVLTSDTFSGRNGHEDRLDATDYEILLYHSSGESVGEGGVARRVTVPAMQTTVIPVRDLLGSVKKFSGGMTIRLKPHGREPMHASDLFSSAFVRWSTKDSFDNVHANPDPLEWQKPHPFYYSMPFPRLDEYQCVFGIFNPYPKSSRGSVLIFDPTGLKLKEISYDLKPFNSRFISVQTGETVRDASAAFRNVPLRRDGAILTSGGGTVAVTNQEESYKAFGFLLINNQRNSRFSIDHPIHQSPYQPVASGDPYDDQRRFKAKNILYTPLIFREKKIGGITLNAKLHLSAGASIEENLWISPFITDSRGEVAWAPKANRDYGTSIAAKQHHRELLKLGGHESCSINCNALSLDKNFSGGLSLAVRANTNHTLMKVELTVPEWGAHAFTHFRPGLQSARNYQRHAQRGGLATDYIASGSRLTRVQSKISRDEVIGVMNIDDKGLEGEPTLEVFSSNGLLVRVALGKVPPFACCHFLLSQLISRELPTTDLTLRLVDEKTTLLMSVIHLDYERRDIALDHGSDRFSTFGEFGCKANA